LTNLTSVFEACPTVEEALGVASLAKPLTQSLAS